MRPVQTRDLSRVVAARADVFDGAHERRTVDRPTLNLEQLFGTIRVVRSSAESAIGAMPAGLPAKPLAQSALASGRLLPVAEPLAPLLPDGGLVRGKAVSCSGAASMSLALAMAVQATATGSWLAVVDVPTFGLEAAEEFGIPLERVVRVDLGHPGTRRDGSAGRGERWAELTAAVLDGFEVVIARVPARLNARLAGRVQSRLQAREAVLITLGSHGPFSVDVELHAADPQWEGVADGWGHLRGRRVAVTSSGRRVPRPRRAALWLPGADGTVAADRVAADV
jgi:hypothetical protein